MKKITLFIAAFMCSLFTIAQQPNDVNNNSSHPNDPNNQEAAETTNCSLKAGLFKIAIMYTDGDGKTFDMDYYAHKHMPMVAAFLGNNLKFYEVDKGISGRTPNDKAPYVAICYFYVSDVAEYSKAIAQNRDVIMNDIKNYTNIQPVVQISEIKQVVYNNTK